MDSPTPMNVRRSERAAEAVWRRLCDGLGSPWLDDVRDLRVETDDFETTLDIWSAALTAELKVPGHRDEASLVLARLRELSEEIEDGAA